MREPSNRGDAWAWWRAHAGRTPSDIPSDPQCGLYKSRRRDGSWAPASIDLTQEIDDLGELVSDERLVCFVDGRERDPVEQWSFLAAHPVSEAEHGRLLRAPRVTDLSRSVIV